MSVGKRIKERRNILNISVEELAMKLNKNRATVYRYENGDIENLPIEVLEPLAEALETTPAYLMGWENSSYDDASIVGKLLRTMRLQQEMSMEELSEEIGITSKDLRMYETGKKRISHELINIISDYYRVSLNSLKNTGSYNTDNNNVRLARLKIWSDNFDHVEFTDEEHDKIVEYAKFLLSLREK